MSLPPGFIDELRTRLTLSDVVGRKVTWDNRKSNQAKGDMWAPCPFHQEKTASFHVDDRKGYYYCFGCHAKGDAISFVRETENMGFMEAIEVLAGEAGMQMPARDPRAKEKADRHALLAELMEHAVQFFRLRLNTSSAAEARSYLTEKRGLSAEALERWEIGFAPDAWRDLWEHLRSKEVAEDLILDAGLAKRPDRGQPYDVFRNRIMFPIRDARGRAIAFGGRAMDPDDNAKYLNSPETLLFDKGRALFNHGPARTASGKGKPVIVAEGYMDVIALSEAGFSAAVAPLGTAVTEDQLRLMWKMADEPVIALDGDKAGRRAAERLIDVALPMLEPGKTLQFMLLPEGQDPDDLLRSKGKAAVQNLLDTAQPLIRLLWSRETEAKDLSTPERRAALDKSLRDILKKIEDPGVRAHYAEAVREMRAALFRPETRARGWKAPIAHGPSAAAKASMLAQVEAEETLREAVILATLIAHPNLATEHADQLEMTEFRGSGHAEIAHAILQRTEIPTHALESLMRPAHVRLAPSVRNVSDPQAAEACLLTEFAKLKATRGAEAEIAEAMAEISDLAPPSDVETDGLTWRIGQAAKAKHAAQVPQDAETADFETAPNGAQIDRNEKQAFNALLEGLDFAKTSRRGG